MINKIVLKSSECIDIVNNNFYKIIKFNFMRVFNRKFMKCKYHESS